MVLPFHNFFMALKYDIYMVLSLYGASFRKINKWNTNQDERVLGRKAGKPQLDTNEQATRALDFQRILQHQLYGNKNRRRHRQQRSCATFHVNALAFMHCAYIWDSNLRS